MADNAVQVPPIRTNLQDPAVTDQTAKEWYLYWKRSGDRINVLNRMIASGPHADRPAPKDAPEGAIYVENDREVIYQNQNGAWHYLAGTMWGTLSPDQRPTDLGPFDGGFDFRGTDQAREFIWSQTAWVEVTAVQYGTHSARPAAASVATGVLYVEWDRGVIYQMQMSGTTPVWQYLAGTMWGTLVPDQRPTDLGPHDVGFDFRTSVAPPREFIWSGGMWVEVTPPANAVIGASNLTHPNVVTRVGSVAGTIYEGGITDQSAANSGSMQISTAGVVGVRGVPLNDANYPFQIHVTTDRNFLFGLTAGQCEIAILNDGINTYQLLRLTASGIVMPNLPSGNPGAGSRQLWYDPADANRVKFAP